jgi:hypothetical protein
MHNPYCGGNEGDLRRGCFEPLGTPLKDKSPSNNSVEQQTGKQMNQQIRSVVIGDIEAACCVVDGERHINSTTSQPFGLSLGQNMTNSYIVFDRLRVIKDKDPAEAVCVDSDAQKQYEKWI